MAVNTSRKLASNRDTGHLNRIGRRAEANAVLARRLGWHAVVAYPGRDPEAVDGVPVGEHHLEPRPRVICRLGQQAINRRQH